MSVEVVGPVPIATVARRVRRSPSDLDDRVRRARDRALDRLLEAKNAEGCWRQPFDLSAMAGAAYVVVLRTSGLIDRREAVRDEAAVVRHMLRQRNPDGGFFKFTGSPSNRAVTGLALTAMRLCLGAVEPGRRPERWFAPNPELGRELEHGVEIAIAEAESFLRGFASSEPWRFEADTALPASILQAFADPARCRPPLLPVGPRLVAAVHRSRTLSRVQQEFSALIHRIAPAVVVLHRAASDGWRQVRHGAPSGRGAQQRRLPGRSAKELAELIASWQNHRGDWFYCTPYTMLNLMALRTAGVPADDPAIIRAYGFLRESLFEVDDGGSAVSLMNSDVWDTSVAVFTYLSTSGRGVEDPEIRPAVEFLLEYQGQDGGYGWGSGSLSDCDTDSTAAVLRALSRAVETAEDPLKDRIRAAMSRCRSYLISRQTRQGGFCVWAPSAFRARRGAFGFLRASLIDVPSADLAARVIAALVHSGSNPVEAPVRRGLRFLRQLQSPNGGWWCRWWTGYISGTAFVLDAFSACGLRWSAPGRDPDRHTEQLRQSMMRGIRFLLDHQNADGGWGETIRADLDAEWAGRGTSRPGQTGAALYGLLSCGYPATSRQIRRGFEWLLAAATGEGDWQDHQATFTILPGSAYYAHPMYSLTILPAALSAYLRSADA